MDTRETYNQIAEDWHKDHNDDSWWIEGTKSFIEKLAPNAHILDVGCGGGVKSVYLQKHGLTVTGIDFSQNLIDIARRENPRIQFEVADMRHIERLDSKYDALFLQASLLHIPKAEVPETLKGLTQLLNPGGLIYIAVKKANEGTPEEEVKEENDYGFLYQRFFSYFTLSELRTHLLALGFEILEETSTPSGNTLWLQIIGRLR